MSLVVGIEFKEFDRDIRTLTSKMHLVIIRLKQVPGICTDWDHRILRLISFNHEKVKKSCELFGFFKGKPLSDARLLALETEMVGLRSTNLLMLSLYPEMPDLFAYFQS
jgi:hypothetical protein